MTLRTIMTAIAAGALLGAAPLAHAQMSPSPAGNAAAAQKQQDDAVNAQAATKLVKPTSKKATAAKSSTKPRQTIGAAPPRKNEPGPSGSVAPGPAQGNSTPGSPNASGTTGSSGSSGSSQGSGSSGGAAK